MGQICHSASPHCRQRQWLLLATFCHLLPSHPQQPQLLLWRGDSAHPSPVPLEFTYSFVHQFVWPLADPICLLWLPLPDIHCFQCKTAFFHLFWVSASFVDCLLALVLQYLVNNSSAFSWQIYFFQNCTQYSILFCKLKSTNLFSLSLLCNSNTFGQVAVSFLCQHFQPCSPGCHSC